MASLEKPRVLVLGGCGQVGRNFVKFLVDNRLCSSIRVADKAIPIVAYFSPEYEAAFKEESVQFVQADLTRAAHLEKVFSVDEGFDFVFNLAAETRLGLNDSAYSDRVTKLAKCAAERSLRGASAGGGRALQRFVHVSTAQVYRSSGRSPAAEDPSIKGSELKPWTKLASASLHAETILQRMAANQGLPLVRLRPAIVYGPADTSGLMPRVVCAAAYAELGETMKFLWDKHLRLNTVHMRDVCRALWHVATSERVTPGPSALFNLADKTDTDQGRVNELLEELFGIKTALFGKLASNVAKLHLDGVVSMSNEKHLKPWGALCAKHGVKNTPLSPFMGKELLKYNHTFVDGSAIEASGFEYEVPVLTVEALREQVEKAIESGHFPPILSPGSGGGGGGAPKDDAGKGEGGAGEGEAVTTGGVQVAAAAEGGEDCTVKK